MSTETEEPPKKDCDCAVCTSDSYFVNSVVSTSSGLIKSFVVQGKSIAFEADSGATVTIMSLKDFSFHFKD